MVISQMKFNVDRYISALPKIADAYIEEYAKESALRPENWYLFKQALTTQFECLQNVHQVQCFLSDDPQRTDWKNAKAEILAFGELPVFTGGSLSAEHPLCEEAPYLVWNLTIREMRVITWNEIFRAVHDYFGHFVYDEDTSYAGEIRAYLHHKTAFPVETHGILFAETIGQLAYHSQTGNFVTPQKPIELTPIF